MKLTILALLTVTLGAAALSAMAQPQRPARNPRPAVAPSVGDRAPDFKLKPKDGLRDVQLSSFKGQRPVVLVFGSFT